MCDWSNWKWMCEGHYEIALTILLSIACVVALTAMAIIAIGKNRKSDARDRDIGYLQEALYRGDISSDEFLRKCNEINNKAAFSIKS